MHKQAAKRHFPGASAGLVEYLSGLTQVLSRRPKWMDKALGPRADAASPEASQSRIVSRHPLPAVAELPAENEVQKSLEVEILNKGGLLQIITRNTIYSFRMLNTREAILSTNKQNRPEGLVQLRGCTYGCSGSITPDRLFCGGNLEFSSNTTRQVHITSEIKAMKWLPPFTTRAA